jgi:hypothetical protein
MDYIAEMKPECVSLIGLQVNQQILWTFEYRLKNGVKNDGIIYTVKKCDVDHI